MSGSALDRLFNNVETQKKQSQMPTLEEQLLEDDDDNEALFIEGMSESSRNALMAKVIETTEPKSVEEPAKPVKAVEKVEFKEEVKEQPKPATQPTVEKVTVAETSSQDDDDVTFIERPAEKPISAEEMTQLNESQDDDVADELVQVTKSKRGRKPKVKQDQIEMKENKAMEKQVSLPTGVGTIMHVLGVTMLQDLLKANYKFREFGKEDTALIIKYLLTQLEGEN